MFLYIVFTPISTTSGLWSTVPAIRINTTKSTYTFTSVKLGQLLVEFEKKSFSKLWKNLFSLKEIDLRIHCLEVSCKEDKITSVQHKWFIFLQLTDKQWIITQQFTQFSRSISIWTRNNFNKRRKHIWSLQLLPTFRHCTEEILQ